MSRPEPDRGAVAFAEKVLTLLGEGRFTATYKYAVLLALMDLCLEHSTRSGAAPSSVTTRQLAAKVLELYWPQSVPFQGSVVLKQNRGPQAKIVEDIRRFRSRRAADPGAPLSRARSEAGRELERLLDRIEWTLIEMPLPRLQVIGDVEVPFIYRINWDASVRRSEVRDPTRFDNSIRFIGDVAEHLVRLAGLLRPLLKREWASMVADLNATVLPEARVEEFLFGAERTSTEPVRSRLYDLAGGRCFYCGAHLRDRFDVDHFIPWARYPDNGIENLVASDSRCNLDKRDHLAAPHHLHRWVRRAHERAPDLAAIAGAAAWDRHPERSLNVARSIYLRLPAGARLWSRRREFVAVDRPSLVRAFGRPQAR